MAPPWEGTFIIGPAEIELRVFFRHCSYSEWACASDLRKPHCSKESGSLWNTEVNPTVTAVSGDMEPGDDGVVGTQGLVADPP
jgi:hypothetical protein